MAELIPDLQVNGYALEQRVADCVAELEAGHDARAIVSHHLGVCYEEFGKLMAENARLREDVECYEGMKERCARYTWSSNSDC